MKLFRLKEWILEAMTPEPKGIAQRGEDGMRHNTWVFDFDGTIADTLEIAREVYNHLAKEHNLQRLEKEEIIHLRDYNVSQFLKYLKIPKIKLPMLLSRGKKEFKKRIKDITLIEGMEEVIPKLREKVQHLGILTSNNKENVEQVLALYGLDKYFDFISTAPKLEGKARHIRAISKTYSLDKSRILYIGDEVRDVKASRKAGVAVCAVTWGFNSEKVLEKAKPSLIAHTPADLLEII